MFVLIVTLPFTWVRFLEIAVRHSGQNGVVSNYYSMHAGWNLWRHSVSTILVLKNGSKHIAQSYSLSVQSLVILFKVTSSVLTSTVGKDYISGSLSKNGNMFAWSRSTFNSSSLICRRFLTLYKAILCAAYRQKNPTRWCRLWLESTFTTSGVPSPKKLMDTWLKTRCLGSVTKLDRALWKY